MICTTGGTIAATTTADGVVTADGASGSQALLATLAEGLPDHVRVSVRPVLDVDSSAMGPEDFDAVVDAVLEALRDGVDGAEVDGVVVTHGTDTLEETALLLDLQYADPRPVVVTGAQRAADHPDPDGPANLLDAVLVASEPAARGLGVLVAFGRAVLQARGLRKWHTTDTVGFARNAPDHVPDSLPPGIARPVLRCRVRFADVRVDAVACPPGSDSAALRACVDAGARGLVLEGLGSGNIPPAVAEAVAGLRPEVVVVLTSRVPRGPVDAAYGGSGGGSTLAAAGALTSGYLRAGQARVLLACLLAEAEDSSDHDGKDGKDGGDGESAADRVRSRWSRFADLRE